MGRSASNFSNSIELLGKWLNNRIIAEEEAVEKLELVQISEIPDHYLNSLLSSKDISENHIIILKEFICAEVLSFEDTLRPSAFLASWDKSEETKLILKSIETNQFKSSTCSLIGL